MVDTSLQRKNMVESQVRPSDVTDRRITLAMSSIAREAFVAPELRALAYSDAELPLGDGRTKGRQLLAPRTLAKMIQILSPDPSDIVLDVGCGTGYATAILSRLAMTVVALEEDQGLAQEATRVLQVQGFDNAAVVQGPLTDGYPSEGPYDRILVGGAVAEPPATLLGQLKDGGRLVAILASGGSSRAVTWTRIGTTYSESDGFDAVAPLLPGFAKSPGFVF
ncbi:MAG: protein-L-isoaspartate O-methyltransferase [Hyphomicrobium sp.]|nr:protein-L-isoaspartate O-methyltransferase [Hyphomicrobium sp.]